MLNIQFNFSKIVRRIVLDVFYPVGRIVYFYDDQDPGVIWGGTWEQIKGRFLLGTGSNDANSDNYWGDMPTGTLNAAAGSTGGAASVNLDVDHIPSHSHPIGSGFFDDVGGYGVTGSMMKKTKEPYQEASWSSTENTGGGQPHSNMPPYLAVYIWRRTA